MNFDALLLRLREMPWARQWRLLAGLALLISGTLGLAIWGFSPEYAPLFPTMSEKDGAAVMTALDQNGYAYKLSPNGMVMVERSKIYEARYKLAASGLPKSGAEETSAPPKFGASSSQEMAYQQKTKELELARTINGIAGISGARVHLALPHQTIFGKETTVPTASVVIDSGAGASRAQAAAIAHLVANATPGLRIADVSVIDGKGRLLTRDDKENNDTPEQRAYATTLRLDLQSRVERLLEPVVGKNGAKAEIDVDLEFGNEEAVTESWKPNVGETSIRSQQTAGSQQGGLLASGIPGSTTNSIPLSLPPLPGQTTTSPAASSSGSVQNVTNYELDRSVVKSIRKGVKIKKIRAAVLIDYKRTLGKDGKNVSLAVAPNDLAKIQALAQEAIGIDEDRGDSLQVLNMAFVENPVGTEDVSMPLWRDPYWIELSLVALKWIIITLGLLWLARQARTLLRDLGTFEGDLSLDASSGGPAGSASASNSVSSPSSQVSSAPSGPLDLNGVRQMAQNNPKAVAAVIKGWVEGEGNE